MKVMNRYITLLTICFIFYPLYSNDCFIVTEIKSDKILYIDNYEYANKMLFPGSLLKPFTILSIPDIHEETTLMCTGWSDLNNRCWSKASHGEIDIIQALAYSCNSFFIQYLGDKLSLDVYHKTLSHHLNFSGSFDSKNYVLESIGLGTNLKTTPLNILKAYNSIFRENPEGIEIIRQGMKDASYYGTGKQLTVITDLWDVACKTGTSYRIMEDGTLDWSSNTGWFLIMYPADDPKYSFLKVIDASKSELAVKKGSADFKRWLDEN